MASTAIFPDLELWLCGRIRATLAGLNRDGVHVSNRDPGPEVTDRFFVSVRYDGGLRTSPITEDASIGVRVGSNADDENWQQASDLARLVRAIVEATPGAELGNPVAAVRDVNGPYRIDGSRPLMYFTAELAVVGQPFALPA